MNNKDFFNNYMKVFLEINSKINLISKNDEKFLWEKHICDSLSIEKFFNKYNIDTKQKTELLDIGTGGGFPAVPIALSYPQIDVYALDSIRKKINAIENIKTELKINNLFTICDRAENINKKFDIVTSRAVAPLKTILEYAMPLLKETGIFIAYKSIKATEEIKDAEKAFKKHNAKIMDIIEYKLPLEENHVRNLIIITRK